MKKENMIGKRFKDSVVIDYDKNGILVRDDSGYEHYIKDNEQECYSDEDNDESTFYAAIYYDYKHHGLEKDGTFKTWDEAINWLTDNGSIYSASCMELINEETGQEWKFRDAEEDEEVYMLEDLIVKN